MPEHHSNFCLLSGYPQSYPSDLHCIWNVKAPPGYKVVGQFVEFDLTDSDDCSSDYVQISGRTFSLIANFDI